MPASLSTTLSKQRAFHTAVFLGYCSERPSQSPQLHQSEVESCSEPPALQTLSRAFLKPLYFTVLWEHAACQAGGGNAAVSGKFLHCLGSGARAPCSGTGAGRQGSTALAPMEGATPLLTWGLSSEGKLQETRMPVCHMELDSFPHKLFWNKQLSQNMCV